ncbi:alpha/beta hydrolase [Pseudomonas citri]|uniref:alpha/beta hydrolase n=1 Tax=Pseudomonas citri TaxID=2978349 RepID=UPI0021B5A418|nr:alpha/beta fold hydrolase [Pseudomonas citri]
MRFSAFGMIWLLSFSVFFAGCASSVSFPAPVSGSEEVSYPMPESVQKTETFAAVKVSYATNRKKAADGSLLPELNVSGDPLSYGQETVLIPLKREVGSFKDSHSPAFKVLMKFGVVDEQDDPIITLLDDKSLTLSEADFFKQFKSTNGIKSNDVLLFVHGFNVKFDDAVKRAAQVSYDINPALQPVVFSWPSIGDPLKYNRDFGRALDSVDDFEKFMLKLATSTQGRRIHILAHSMGSKVVIPALARLYSTHTKLLDKKLSNIILAAPDFPRETFISKYKTAFSKFGRATVYMSSEDKALLLSSSTYLADREMLGFSGPEGFYSPGIDSVDITRAGGIDDLLGHSKYGSSARVLVDMQDMIGKNLRANKRKGFIVEPPYPYFFLQP